VTTGRCSSAYDLGSALAREKAFKSRLRFFQSCNSDLVDAEGNNFRGERAYCSGSLSRTPPSGQLMDCHIVMVETYLIFARPYK
jgi:hypothetical protein